MRETQQLLAIQKYEEIHKKEQIMEKEALRTLVKSLYDLQKLRVQTGNRIAGNFRVKMGQDPGKKLDDESAEKILSRIKAEYSRLTDGIVALTAPQVKKLIKRSDGIITDEVEFRLVQSYLDMIGHEKRGFRNLESLLGHFQIYTEFMKQVKGIGPALAAIIISELDPTKARYSSSFWRYAGLDVNVEDGKGRSRRKEHLVMRKYVKKDGTEGERLSITFNPLLKTKLVGVLGPSFLKSRSEPYSQIYYDYRNRLENHPKHTEKSKGHRHAMAVRYTVKIFLLHLWTKWRELEGLPVTEPYAQTKLGLQHAV